MRTDQDSDLELLCAFDAVAQQDPRRRDFLARAVACGACHVAADDRLLGYAILDYTFFDNGFVHLLYVHPNHRRRGVGEGLMRHLEASCRTAKLFTSTNLSNLPMQALLAKLGYRLSGVIHDLDEGDPELVYVKYLKQAAEARAGQHPPPCC